MISAIFVRHETPKDRDQIRNVTIEAFTQSEFGHNGEADLIDSLREQCANVLSLVACYESEIVGHILFTPVVIETSRNRTVGMGLAPMSVAPQHQRAGVGSTLLTSGLHRLHARNCPFVVVLGHPNYYPRFGFRLASIFGIAHGFPGIPQDLFFIQIAAEETIVELKNGKAFYHAAFGRQHDDQ